MRSVKARGKIKLVKTKQAGYEHEKIESKWQEEWVKESVYSPDIKAAKNTYYNLMMFPYPSAEGLHVGNVYAFTGSDIWGRYQRMQGKDVFEPIGLDGFGIHSENYAIKIGTHPVEQSQKAEGRFYKQLQSIGNGYAWDKRVETYNPNYYRWTQWLFVQMFKNGLAYRQKAAVNWCPSCMTVLADEQVIAEKCERCSSTVEQRDLEQWFFRITDYADRLLSNLETIDWAQKVKIAQKQWIGRSVGAEIRFRVKGSEAEIKVFTTRPDTLTGATFLVVAPEHELAKGVDLNQTEGEKNGAFAGIYAINPATEKEIPIWVSDYVLSGYGTGAIMAVPAHDERDAEFAKKYNLPVIDVDTEGTEAQIQKSVEQAEEKGWAKGTVNYHLRDWLISRQRYWGPPIPMIYCQSCASADKSWFETGEGASYRVSDEHASSMAGWYPVPEKNLPLELPFVENFKPTGTGESPLGQDKDWVNTKCPACGSEARRETDVSDTFLDSAWYFLRYPSVGTDDSPFNPEITKKWLPVNMYIGGAEHSVLHLMYSRFVCMALKDWGIIDFEEPFTRFYAHGLIIKDGAKMSKSKGNVVVPDEYVQKYGADTLRTYLMFLGPYEAGGDFRDSGIEGMGRFIKRVHTLITEHFDADFKAERAKEMGALTHKTIKRVTHDLDDLRYNRAIAGIMEYVNGLTNMVGEWKEDDPSFVQIPEWKESIKTLLLLLAPFAPHMTEELWQTHVILNGVKDLDSSAARQNDNVFKSIHQESWPKFDESKTVESSVNIPVQVNGKMRGSILLDTSEVENQELVENEAKKLETVARQLEGKSIQKVIYVKGRLINFVVS